MNLLLEWIISNTVIATGLALIAILVTRFGRTPTLSHVLWLLVLVKLVTPPIWNVPIKWTPPVERAAVSIAEPVVESGPSGEKFYALNGAETQSPVEAAETIRVVPETSPVETESFLASEPVGIILLLLWAFGSITWFLLAGWRTWRFGKMLVHATPVSAELREKMREIATRMGLKKTPHAVTVDAVLPPLLWPFFRGATITLPVRLLNTLSQNELVTLIAHELAHYRRRDHWLRWFESAVLGIYWWHPLVWWSRHELRRAEEDCCDAWVLWAFPESVKNYAESLMKTFDFLAGKVKSVPAMACGFGKKGKLKNVKERFEMILNTKPAHRMSWKQVVFTGLLAIATLPLSGYLLEAQVISAGKKEQPVDSSIDPISEPQLVEDRLAKLEAMIEKLLQNPSREVLKQSGVQAGGTSEQPNTESRSNSKPGNELFITITGTGMELHWSLNGFPLSYGDLHRAIGILGDQQEKPALTIHADVTTPFLNINQLMEEAKDAGITKINLAQAKSEESAFKTSIFSLKYASASELSEIIEDLFSGSSTQTVPVEAVADERTNSLIVKSPESYVESIVELIRQIDIDENSKVGRARIIGRGSRTVRAVPTQSSE